MAVQGKQCHFLENKIHHSKTLDVIRTRLNQRNEKKPVPEMLKNINLLMQSCRSFLTNRIEWECGRHGIFQNAWTVDHDFEF